MAMPFAQREAASNDNMADIQAGELIECGLALKAFILPYKPGAGTVALTFHRFREAFMAYVRGCGMGSAVDEAERRQLGETAFDLAETPCRSALDLAMKALAFRSLVAACTAYGSCGNDTRRLADETRQAADFGAYVAANAVELASAGGLVLQ